MWVLTILGGIAGIFTFSSIYVQESAPQQAAVAGIAMALVVLPYCIARALTEIKLLQTTMHDKNTPVKPPHIAPTE